MPRSVKFELYQVVLPDDAGVTFGTVLTRIGDEEFQARNVDRTDGFLRLQELRRDRQPFFGTMIRGREDELPLRTDRDGALAPLPLAATEGLGEETSFLYRLEHSILVLQVNRNGVRAGAFADYFSRMGDVPVALDPVVDPQALERLDRMPVIRSFTFRVAAGDNLGHYRAAGRRFVDAVRLAEQLNGVQIDVLVNRGHYRGSLDSGGVRELARRLLQIRRRNEREVTKLEVTGRMQEDGPPEVLDLLEHRVVNTVPIELRDRRIHREDCWRALRHVYDDREALLRERFGSARRRG